MSTTNAERSTTKQFAVGGKSWIVTGLHVADPYFSILGDDFNADFDALCRRHIGPHFNCWDIGSNIGVTTLYIANACKNGRVVAVEANRPVFALLEQNISDNDLTNTTAICTCVGDADRSVRFLENTVYGHMSTSPDVGVAVDMISPDTLFARSHFDRLDFVKVDIEGSEFGFMKSAKPLFDRHKPIIHMEFNSWCLMANARINPLDFAEWLFENFPYVYVPKGTEMLIDIKESGPIDFLHSNVVHRSAVQDIVLSYRPLN